MLTSQLRFFVSFLSCVIFSHAWTAYPDIRTGQQMMFSSSALTPYTSTQPPISYSVLYSSPINSNTARSAGVGIVGYQSTISNDFSVNMTIQNFTSSSLRLTLRVYGDTSLTLFSVNWIAVGNAATFIQVLVNCYLSTVLDRGRGFRSESFTGNTLFIGYTTLSVNVYLTGFTMNNGDGLTNYLSASAYIPSGSNIIYYTFATNQNNTVTEICYTTLIYCDKVTKTLYISWGTIGNRTLSNQAAQSPTTFPFPASIDYRRQNSMFFGMSVFSLSRAHSRQFYLNTTSYADLTQQYSTNVGTYAVTIDFFWIADRNCNNSNNQWFNILTMQCDNNCSTVGNVTVYETDPGRICAPCDYTCQTCNAAHTTNCTGCDFNMSRNFTGNQCPCNISFIDVGVSLCYPCQNFIAGCYTCTSTTFCTSCFPGFVLQPNGFCQCSAGFLVSGVCTNITGCISIVSYSGTLYCTACNSSLHFAINSMYTCSCTSGYYISSNQICLPRCGDGRKVTEEPCDDGNVIDGDGCSSACLIQGNWTCIGGSPTSASFCAISASFQMAVKYVRRITTMNRMQVGIKITPLYTQFTLISFKQFISTNVPCTDFNATYINSELILDFDYNRSIEGQYFNFSLTLDPTSFANTTLFVQIPASGMNAKLTYDSNNSFNYPFEIIVVILDVLAIIVLFASCLSERMIGIQMIQTLQTVLFAQSVMKTTPSSLSPLQMLRYSSGYNEIGGIDYDRTFTFAFSLSSIGLQKQFLLSFNLMYLVLMLVIIICLILKAKLAYHHSEVGKYIQYQQQKKNKQKINSTTKIYNFIFERILFIVGFMCMFLVVFALMFQITDMAADYQLVSKQLNMIAAGMAIAIICTLICSAILNGCFPGTLIFPMLMKQYYPPIYFIYQSTFIFVLAFNYTQQYVLYVLAGMSFIFMVYNMIHRPYPEKIHTFVLIFHQIVIMCAIGVYVFENLTKPTQHETLYRILNAVIILLLYIVVGLNAYRLYRYDQYLKQRGWDQYGNQLIQGDDQESNSNYKQLKTPKDLNKTGIQQNYLSKTGNNKRKNQFQLQPIKRANKEPKTKPIQDQSQMDWKFNKLAEQQNLRYQATGRDIQPDSSRDRELNRKKTDKNLKANENYDEQFTIKDAKSKNYADIQQIENSEGNVEYDNPYDEDGYEKKTPDRTIEDDDPLKAIKRKLRKDFNSKVKTSTIKEMQ